MEDLLHCRVVNLIFLSRGMQLGVGFLNRIVGSNHRFRNHEHFHFDFRKHALLSPALPFFFVTPSQSGDWGCF